MSPTELIIPLMLGLFVGVGSLPLVLWLLLSWCLVTE